MNEGYAMKGLTYNRSMPWMLVAVGLAGFLSACLIQPVSILVAQNRGTPPAAPGVAPEVNAVKRVIAARR